MVSICKLLGELNPKLFVVHFTPILYSLYKMYEFTMHSQTDGKKHVSTT